MKEIRKYAIAFWDKECRVVMKEFEGKDGFAILRRFRVKEIHKYGIAFWDKECRVAEKTS